VVSDAESHITASVRPALPVPVNLEYLLAGNDAQRWVDYGGGAHAPRTTRLTSRRLNAMEMRFGIAETLRHQIRQ
jgi:hypothetical protein